MRLEVITPVEVILDIEATRIVADAPNGAFGMLPRHADFVTLLVPGILTYETEDGREGYVGINSGTLVKCGSEVLVSVLGAVLSDRLEDLAQRVVEDFKTQDEEERQARSALARLEAGMVRHFQKLELDYP
ncbi:F0F1 ATP synthase subunit epsilon [Marimonas arenosa]|nr:F0F1 ATP synthase subunit epsilon [Marimonas arenosa]